MYSLLYIFYIIQAGGITEFLDYWIINAKIVLAITLLLTARQGKLISQQVAHNLAPVESQVYECNYDHNCDIPAYLHRQA